MTGVLINREILGTQRDTGGTPTDNGGKMRVMHLQAKEHQGLMAVTRSYEKDMNKFSPRA